ncbi:translation initiation factor-like protein [Leptomonas pyrrhocoris]|uniref:Translation initiation factor-like protein n=1 Tax=Leptomonas pyrrhocoris TaxID=157538 RepID=A0A0M9FRU2_LEPPY|nr:translation initiation factor-like protein [Leptomonas pyrrhocoris]XP_015653146.1 translation initiation factor-like protein [Leptomonas pyrrhocoris]KPA74706.1 translation initiation factor-like protein [Leptomonas pyrrhocoris]KPA74707.1 translation initiation factor-like protein [Leptomonas pyrrhocoris]|eukprot:XP_015653145.1 translation initiation factor-like protein [Leptomonas pyrrhocoris]
MPRETGRRRRNADDDESSGEDEQQQTTTTNTQATGATAPEVPVAPTRARAKAPPAALVKPPTHADPAAAAASNSNNTNSVTAPAPVAAQEGEEQEGAGAAKATDAATAAAAAAHASALAPNGKDLANLQETIDYDALTYTALLALMKQVSRPVLEELMAQREQQIESTMQQQQGQRVERFLDLAASPSADATAAAAAGANSSDADPVEGYRYNAMLTRLFEALNRNNESSAMTERNQVPVPILERMGKKKTVIANFGRICEAFHRPMEDVKDFIEKELSIRGNLDSNNALILKFEIRKQTDFDRVLIKYLDEYVKCNSCHRIDTTLTKDGRRLELRCNVCTATRTVTAAGSATFSAQIEKRSRQRAAMTL